MAAHGIHMVPMNIEVYEAMGDIPDVDICWSLVRERIGRLLFSDSYATVPYLTSADFYSQYFVFTKRRTVMDMIMRRPPVYEVIGNMEFMIDRTRSTWLPQFDFSQWDINDSHTMYNDYRVHLMSASNAEPLKTLEVVFRKLRVRAVSLPIQELIVMNRQSVLYNDLRDVKYVYVITEVVLASYAHLLVRIGTQQTFVQYDRDIPIAFKYKKYKVKNDGTIFKEVETQLKYNDHVAHWLRPADQPIPRPQLFNRDKIERKNRTVLTVTKRDNNTDSLTAGLYGRTTMARYYRTIRPHHLNIVDEATRENLFQALRQNMQMARIENDRHDDDDAA